MKIMPAGRESSAGNTRGLIEATQSPEQQHHRGESSAGNTRGLIEAWCARCCQNGPNVFRGEYPRPH